MSGTSQEWHTWAAYNLAMGTAPNQILAELEKNGWLFDEAENLIRLIEARPEFVAASKLASECKKTSALCDVLLQLESQSYDFERIERRSGLSSRQFHEEYYCLNRPVIIEDCVSNWPAISKWDDQFLSDNFGKQMVVYQQGRSVSDHRDCFVDHSARATLDEFLNVINASSANSAPAYLIAHDRLLDKPEFRPLLDDMIFDERYLDTNLSKGTVFFWMGSRGSATPLHRDLGNVYLAQIKGQKIVKMIPSKQMHLVYNEVGYHSEVDLRDLDLAKYPLTKLAYMSETLIGPGDFLFIPVGWWHDVVCVDKSITITGNNFRFKNSLKPLF